MDNLEVIVINWLRTVAPEAYPVSGDIPKERPATFITVDRTRGGREAMVLDRAEILIEVYNKDSRLDCSDQANLIADKIPQLLAYEENITHADVNSLINVPDLVGGFQRYQLYCDIYYRRNV